MNTKEAIENYKKMFHEFEDIIAGIDSANSFDELVPYERKILKAAYALRVSQNQALAAVSGYANFRRNYLRQKPVAEAKPVENSAKTEEKPVEKSTKAKKATKKAKK